MEGKKSRTTGQNCQAVSEVYGTLLLLIVTIILASSLVYPNIPKSAPIANILIEVHKDVPAGGDLPETFSGSENNTSSGSGTGPENNNSSGSENNTSSGSGSNISSADNYLLEASSGSGGSISPAGKMYVFGGSNVTFNMTPSANYKVLDVLVDGKSIGPISTYTFNNISSNHSIYVNFTAGNYLLAASSGPGGSISPAGKTYVFGGSNVTFNMTPVVNYKVLDVLVDGKSVGPVSKYTFNNVSSNHSIYVNFTVDFVVINNNTVVPKGNFTVNATVLGAAFVREAKVNGKETMVPFPITCRLKLGNYNYDPWGDYTNPSKGNINNGKNYSLWESRISFNANTPVTVEACSWEYNKQNKILEVSTSNYPSNLKVLKNGDSVPDIPGFKDQKSIEYFVKDYIKNGSIRLKENEAIYLFELGNTNLKSSGADFQDLVILISVNAADTPQSVVSSQEPVSSQELVSSQNLVSPQELVSSQNLVSPQELVSSQNLVSFWELIPSQGLVSSQETIYKFVIKHLGGDEINFKSTDETKVILQKGDEQRYLNFTKLGVFKAGDSAIIDLEYDDPRGSFVIHQGDQLIIKIVDLPSKCLICSRSITVK
jgi:hypothetical protein